MTWNTLGVIGTPIKPVSDPRTAKDAQTDVHDLDKRGILQQRQPRSETSPIRFITERFRSDGCDAVPAWPEVCDGAGAADRPVLGLRVGGGEDHIWQTRCLLEQLQPQVSFP